MIRWLVFVAICFSLLSPLGAGAQVDESDVTETPLPYLPTATFGQRTIALQSSSDIIFDEPLYMYFQVFGFPTPDEASKQLDPIFDHYLTWEQSELDSDNWYDFDEVSIGTLGDDRRAFATEAREILYESSSKMVHLFIQSGPNILYLQAMSFGGETLEYVAEFANELIQEATDDPASLLPTLEDLPIGWQLPDWGPENFLANVTAAPTPVPSPTPLPPPTAIPTAIPVQGTVVIVLPEWVTETAADGSCHGVDGFSFLSEGLMVTLSSTSADGENFGELALPAGELQSDGRCAWTVSVGPIDTGDAFLVYFLANDISLGVVSRQRLLNPADEAILRIYPYDYPELWSTPTVVPTPESTSVPTDGELDDLSTTVALESDLATAESSLTEAESTISALETAVVTQAGLYPEMIVNVIEVDLNGVLSEDPIAIQGAERALDDVFVPFLERDGCFIGVAMIASRADDIGQGVQLSEAVADIIETRYPTLLQPGTDELAALPIAYPNTTPVGEVELGLFMSTRCMVG